MNVIQVREVRKMVASVKSEDVERLLKVCSPSRLDSLLRKICLKYRPESSKPSMLYDEIHNLAVVILLARLRQAGIEVEGEIPLEYGVVDLVVRHKGEIVAVIEVKTGRVKLIQSAVYAHIAGKPVYVVETRTGQVTRISPQLATRLVEEFVGLLKDIKEVRGGGVIPNPGCRYCVEECRYSNGRAKNGGGPEKNLLRMLDNIDVIVERLVEELREEIKRSSGPGNSVFSRN
ncbi:hypothetical protein [Geoglobus ahangari]